MPHQIFLNVQGQFLKTNANLLPLLVYALAFFGLIERARLYIFIASFIFPSFIRTTPEK